MNFVREFLAWDLSNSNSPFTESGLSSEAIAIKSYLLSSPDKFSKVVNARVISMKLERFGAFKTPKIIEMYARLDRPGESEGSQNCEFVENEDEGLVLILDIYERFSTYFTCRKAATYIFIDIHY
jgi:hypothetical protein